MVIVTAMPVFTVLGHLLVPIGPVWQHLATTVLRDYVINSCLLMVGVTGLAMMIAIPAAWLVAIYDFPGRRWIRWALLAPSAVPAYIAAYAYTDFLQFSGPLQSALRDITGWRHGDYWFPPIRSTGGAIMVMALVMYPYIYLFAMQAFSQQGRSLLAVARSLGHGPVRAFFRIALPAVRPALAGGAALVAMETLADFGTVDYFAIPTFTTGIYRSWFNMGAPAAAARLSAMLVVLALILLCIERFSRVRQRFSLSAQQTRPMPVTPLKGGQALLASLACLLPVLTGFVGPIAILGYLAADVPASLLWRNLDRLLGDSVILAGLSAILTLATAMLITGLMAGHAPIRNAVLRLCSLGYAVPGTVMAVGILIPAGTIDQALGHAAFGGSIVLVLYAYVVRFLSVAREGIEAGMARFSAALPHAARILGAGRWRRWTIVQLPLLGPTLITTGMMVALDTIKELPATLILRPFNFETLAIRVYRYAGDERLSEAAMPALCMIGLGILPVLLMVFLTRQHRWNHQNP